MHKIKRDRLNISVSITNYIKWKSNISIKGQRMSDWIKKYNLTTVDP